MTSFFAGLVHTEIGVTCSDSGFVDLSTAQECSGAVSYATSFNNNARYDGDVSEDYFPKGCYIWPLGDMFFNSHSTGGVSAGDTFRSICRKGKT